MGGVVVVVGGGGGLEEFIFTFMMRINKGFLWVQNNDF